VNRAKAVRRLKTQQTSLHQHSGLHSRSGVVTGTRGPQPYPAESWESPGFEKKIWVPGVKSPIGPNVTVEPTKEAKWLPPDPFLGLEI